MAIKTTWCVTGALVMVGCSAPRTPSGLEPGVELADTIDGSSGAVSSCFEARPLSSNYGSVEVGTALSQFVSVHNRCPREAALESAELIGDSDAFSVSGWPFSLRFPAGMAWGALVTFEPMETGEFQARLVLDEGDGTIEVGLVGRGVR